MLRQTLKKFRYKGFQIKKVTSTKLFLVLVFFFSLLFAYTNNTFAYNIQPAIENLVLEINEERTSSIYFTNTTEERQNFKVYSHRYNPEQEQILDERNFITPNIDFFSLEPNEKFEIGYTIKIPDDTIAGSYFSVIVVENIKGKTPTTTSAIGINYGIGSLVAMHVIDDTDIAQIFLTQTEVELKYIKPLNPFNSKLEYKIKNNSKYTFLPSGQLVIGSKGQKPVFYQINPEETKLYPNKELVFEFTYNGNIKDLIVNKKALARIGMQFSSVLRETEIELPFLNRTLTIVITFSIIAVVVSTVVLMTKKETDKKLKEMFRNKLRETKNSKKK